MSDLIFKGTVDEIDVGKLKMGLPARIKVGALPTDVVTGQSRRASRPRPSRRTAPRSSTSRSSSTRRTNVTLRAGYSANADLIIREKKDVLPIPERLVIFEDGGKKTFVELPGATEKAPPVKTAVKLGVSDGLNVEVVGGRRERREGPRAAAQEADLGGGLAGSAPCSPSATPSARCCGTSGARSSARSSRSSGSSGARFRQPAAGLRQGAPGQMIVNSSGIGDAHLHRLAGADLDPLRGARQGPADPPQRGRRRGDPHEARGVNAISGEYSKTLEAQLRHEDDRRRHLGRRRRSSARCAISFPQAGGRFINPIDMAEQRRVLFIGNKLAEDIFGKDGTPSARP